MIFKYGMRLRGFSPMCQPMKGLVKVEDGTTEYWSILSYSRELTAEELENYELEFIGAEGGVGKVGI